MLLVGGSGKVGRAAVTWLRERHPGVRRADVGITRLQRSLGLRLGSEVRAVEIGAGDRALRQGHNNQQFRRRKRGENDPGRQPRVGLPAATPTLSFPVG